MATKDPDEVPDARLDPPWSDCGDPRGADFGRVFAHPVADGAMALSFDRAGHRHALTLFASDELGAEIIIYGRRFGVVRQA